MKWSWHGAVALVLAASIGISLMVAFVSVAISDSPITETGATLLSTAVGGIIGALSTYLGIQSRRTETTTNGDTTEDTESAE